ncbi:MAG: hypothetical protein AB8E15_04275 [Bdellovibrionales bacterium]
MNKIGSIHKRKRRSRALIVLILIFGFIVLSTNEILIYSEKIGEASQRTNNQKEYLEWSEQRKVTQKELSEIFDYHLQKITYEKQMR